ncbi:MAG: HAMP domain-containing histidine kinase [Treponema sp.]|nr:HAMP domain-containing histidine kinase [Treponema sp.]
MKKLLMRFRSAFFAPHFDLRVRLFHVLALGGTLISLLMMILGIITNSGFVNIAFNLGSAVLSYTLLTYSRLTRRYKICYLITVIIIFMGLFPVLFFSSGGYHSGMPAFFVFAVAFTVFMLEGKKAIFFSLAELLLYTAICLIAYYYPETVNAFAREQEVLLDIIIAFISVSLVLGASLFLHFRLYNEQQKKLDEQNTVLDHASRAKTAFLANTSHEMRTPLTIISVNVQTVMEILEDMGGVLKDKEAGKLLETAQDEIMRLARMVGGMLNLTSMSESAEKEMVDFTALLTSSAEMLRLSLQRSGNSLVTGIEAGLSVFGSADLLAQVLTNLIQNAGQHTKDGTINLSAARNSGVITVTIADNGSGIPENLLSQVFERGVSDGGTGFGLYLCRTVVESHGGRIWIESRYGSGTSVFFTLPVYEGQYGGQK